jgi:hypothetical protein
MSSSFVDVLGGVLEIKMDENETLRVFLFPAPEIAKIRHPCRMKRCGLSVMMLVLKTGSVCVFGAYF